MSTTSPLTDDERWAVVTARAPGDFFLGVVTTGVFCRPGCPARTPLRRNVRFYAAAHEAAAAGFRPCLKCRPLGADPNVETAVRAARAIEADPGARWTGAELAAATGVSARTAAARFEAALGLGPRAFRDAVRLRRYQGALRAGEGATNAGLDAGYASEAARHEGTKALGMTARAYAAGGAGEAIEWLSADSALGPMALAATAKGLCLLRFTDDAAPEDVVRAAFPAAELSEAAPDGRLGAWAGAVAAFLDRGGPRPDLPTDLRGTAFQRRVWQALSEIAPGETPTYAEIAARIGSPKAHRAVGSANGKNPVAVVVPCHLVVASGGLGGYASGLERKRRLLALEAGEAGEAGTAPSSARGPSTSRLPRR